MFSGLILGAAGLMVYSYANRAAGIVLLIAGVSLVVISISLYSLFSRIDAVEMMKNNK